MTLLGAFVGFVAAAFIIGPGEEWRGEVNGPFKVGDLARILVEPHKDRVARVGRVWPERQQARLEVGEPVWRYGEDTFAWYQLAREEAAASTGQDI